MDKSLMHKRFLITGGCGFIGSHLVERLNKAGSSIVVIDDLSSGYLENLTNQDLLDVFIKARVQDVDLTSLGSFDAVFHLAAQASVPLSIQNFYESSATNLLSTIKIIDFCSNKNIPMVYASSSAVYGNLRLGDEEGSVDLLSPYSADKFVSEIYCNMAYKLFGLRSFGLRFFNVYGPRQDPTSAYSGVISIFADRILKGEKIVINGGHQTRDFIYVTDVVNGICSGYQYLRNNSVSTYSNLLTGKSISIDELANIMISLAGRKVEKVYRQLPIGDPEMSLGKVDRMSEKLILNEFIQLEDGLFKVLSWMKKRHE